MMRTSNPALTNAFSVPGIRAGFGETMTVNGTIYKTLILLACALVPAMWTWNQFFTTRDPAAIGGYTMIGAIGGLIVAMVTIFKKEWSPVTAPLYAALEGLLLGGISAMFELRFPGIAIESVALTFGTCLCLLLAYRSGLIRVTQKFTAGTGGRHRRHHADLLRHHDPGIFRRFGSLHLRSGPIGIGFSLVVVVIAALNLILDFHFIEQGALCGELQNTWSWSSAWRRGSPW